MFLKNNSFFPACLITREEIVNGYAISSCKMSFQPKSSKIPPLHKLVTAMKTKHTPADPIGIFDSGIADSL